MDECHRATQSRLVDGLKDEVHASKSLREYNNFSRTAPPPSASVHFGFGFAPRARPQIDPSAMRSGAQRPPGLLALSTSTLAAPAGEERQSEGKRAR